MHVPVKYNNSLLIESIAYIKWSISIFVTPQGIVDPFLHFKVRIRELGYVHAFSAHPSCNAPYTKLNPRGA